MAASVDAPSATIGATAEAEQEVEDVGTTVALAKGGVIGLVRTAGEDQSREGAWRDQPREDRPQGNAGLPPLPPPPRRNDDHHQDEGAGGFQEPRAIACILGGAQAPASQRIFKQFAREVNAVLPKLEATRPLRFCRGIVTSDVLVKGLSCGAIGDSGERLGWLKLIVRHLEIVEVSTDRTLSLAPPSMRVLVTCTLLMTGEQSIGRCRALELIR